MSIPLFSPEPVRDPAQFVGREREIVQISELLAAGRSCALIGPPGAGKTSLLWHLEQTADLLLDVPPVTVYLDLSGVRTGADFYAPILRAMGEPGDDELALGQALLNAPDAQVLLLLDRLEAAGGGFSGLVRSALRGWLREGRVMVLAASDQALDRAAPDLQTALFQVALPPMSEREARALALSLLDRLKLAAEPAAVSELIGVAGGYPERVRRAVELWARSERGATFDWTRTFREEYPQQPVLDNSIAAYAPAMETDETEAEGSAAPARATLRQRALDRQRPRKPTYRSDDPSVFLLTLVLLAGAGMVWWAVGGWQGGLAFAGLLLALAGAARLLIEKGGPRWSATLFVAAVRGLPLVGRLVPSPPPPL
ncbi:MAG TPA: ATP-binding protein [Herpetosiphonaceae bacterium]